MRVFVLLVCLLFSGFASAQVLAPASPAGVVFSQNQAGFFPPGQIAYYRFSEGGGNNTADESGKGNTGTLLNSGIGFGPGMFGSGLSGTGSGSGYVNLNSSIEIAIQASNSCSVSAWVYLTSSPVVGLILGNSTSGACGFYYRLGYLTLAAEGESEYCISTVAVPLNKWVHVAGTTTLNSPASCSIYLNGVLGYSSSVSAGSFGNSGVTQIGGDSNNSYQWPGYIDEVRICACVWPSSVIAQIYNYVGP